MRFSTPIVMILLLMCCGLTTSVLAADQVSISVLVQNGEEFKDKIVTVNGKVANSTVVEDDGPIPSQIKGTYELTDGKATIKVLTTQSPPPNGIKRTVRGKVAMKPSYGPDPILVETGGIGDIPLYLYAALGGLALAAIILVALIVRKPVPQPAPSKTAVKARPAEPPIVSPTATVKPQAAPSTRCPKCGHENVPDAQWCEECGESLKAPSIRPERTGSATSLEVSNSRKRETVMFTPSSNTVHPLANLTVIEGEGANKALTYALTKGQHKIGRSDEMDFILPEETVSRRHATIWWEDSKFFIGDEDSTSGTLVNGQRVKKSAPITLNDNDTIQLGKTKLLFRLLPGDGE